MITHQRSGNGSPSNAAGANDQTQSIGRYYQSGATALQMPVTEYYNNKLGGQGQSPNKFDDGSNDFSGENQLMLQMRRKMQEIQDDTYGK